MNQPRALARPLCWGFCFQPMSIMSLPSLQKLLLMLLLQFTADQRKEFFTLLSFCWSKTIRITDGFPARCSLAGRQFGVYKRFNENLAPDQLLANALGLSTRTQANQDPKKKKKSNDLFSPNEEVKSFTWGTKPKWANRESITLGLSSWSLRLLKALTALWICSQVLAVCTWGVQHISADTEHGWWAGGRKWHPGVCWKSPHPYFDVCCSFFCWVMTLLLCPGWEFLCWPFCLVGFFLDDMSSSLKLC